MAKGERFLVKEPLEAVQAALSGLGRVVLKARKKQRTAFYPTCDLRTNLSEMIRAVAAAIACRNGSSPEPAQHCEQRAIWAAK